jgi:2-oxoglutarate ferredoxin oxidoreductase subunit alpha
MVKARAAKIKKIADDIPDLIVHGEDSGELLLTGWGGTRGYLVTAAHELREDGYKVSFANFNYINPLPKNIGDIFSRFKKIAVAELNLGQFADYLRIRYPEFNYYQINKVQGMPFTIAEIKNKCIKILKGE